MGKAYPFHRNRSSLTVSFADGHVKRMSAAELVAGWDAFLWDTYR